MAVLAGNLSIRRRQGTKFWFACYYREDGSRAQTSTKTTDRKAAQRIADDLEDAHTRKATEGQMRRILSDLSVRLAGKPLATATLREYATDWLRQKELQVERVSYLAYKTGIEDFVASVPATASCESSCAFASPKSSSFGPSGARSTADGVSPP